jgi:protein-disulfide isomerase
VVVLALTGVGIAVGVSSSGGSKHAVSDGLSGGGVSGGASSPGPVTSGGTPSGGGGDLAPVSLVVGQASAPVTLTVYEDFRCPDCQQFEEIVGPTYRAYVEAGRVKVDFRPVDLIDSMHAGTTGSDVAGSAAICAQVAGHFLAYHDVLYRNQPSEMSDDFSDTATLIRLAKQVPGLDTPAFEQCVTSVRYKHQVAANFAALTRIDDGNPGTPTMLMNGKRFQFSQSDQTDGQAIADFESALRAAGAGAPPSGGS